MKPKHDLTTACSLAAIFLFLAMGIDIPTSAAQGVDRPTQRPGAVRKSDRSKSATSAAAQITSTTVASAALIAATAKQMNLQLSETNFTLTPRQLYVAGKGHLVFFSSAVDPEANEALLSYGVGVRIVLAPGAWDAKYFLACTVRNDPAMYEFRDEPHDWKTIQTTAEAPIKYRYLFFVASTSEKVIILRGNIEVVHFYSCVITNLK